MSSHPPKIEDPLLLAHHGVLPRVLAAFRTWQRSPESKTQTLWAAFSAGWLAGQRIKRGE